MRDRDRRETTRSGVMSDNWDTKFDDPIPLPDGGELVMLKDAGEYIRQLPTDIRESDRWQIAIKDLSRAVETPAWRLLARRAIVKALRAKTSPSSKSLSSTDEKEGAPCGGWERKRDRSR
jgi:hypothetical protein